MSTAQKYLDGTYAAAHPTWHSECSPWKAQQVLKLLGRTGIQSHTIAEVGCGGGGILFELRSQLPGAVLEGYDVSPQAISLAKQRPSADIAFHCEDFLEANRKFDLVLLMDVVEHLEDYFTFLRTIRQHTRHVIIHFPLDMSVYGVLRGTPMAARRSDGHLHYFSKDTALSTMEDCGYQILDWMYTPKQEVASGLKNSVTHFVRRSLYRIAPDATVLALGCFGLLVAAR
jgi:cyclopropane fatty-acyl-phospholipid synthase-like methyltransferase